MSLILVGAVSLKNIYPLSFNVTGSERCIFNLIIAPHIVKDASTTDFVDHLAISNRGLQLWTNLSMSTNETNKYLFLTSNYLKFKEYCSVNILVSVVGCSTLHLDFILGSRFYNPRSIVYIFHGESIQNCDGSRYRSIKYGARVRFAVVYIYLAHDKLSVARAYLLCIK